MSKSKIAVFFVLTKVLLVVFALHSPAYPQEHLDDVLGSSTLDHNFFVASQNDQLKTLLSLVERFHLIACPHNPGGPMGDIRVGRYDLAFGDLGYVLERFVNHPTALQILGLIARLKNNPSLPIPFYNKALFLYPRYAVTYAQLGGYLVSINRVREGIEKLKEAVEIDGKLVVAHVWLAKAYGKIGDSELAQHAAEVARSLGFSGQIVGGADGDESLLVK